MERERVESGEMREGGHERVASAMDYAALGGFESEFLK